MCVKLSLIDFQTSNFHWRCLLKGQTMTTFFGPQVQVSSTQSADLEHSYSWWFRTQPRQTQPHSAHSWLDLNAENWRNIEIDTNFGDRQHKPPTYSPCQCLDSGTFNYPYGSKEFSDVYLFSLLYLRNLIFIMKTYINIKSKLERLVSFTDPNLDKSITNTR